MNNFNSFSHYYYYFLSHYICVSQGKNDNGILKNDELTDSEKRVLLELINNPSVPYDKLVVELNISRRTVSRVFTSLVEKGYIERVGTNKKGYWKVLK